ncbi:MAG: hypothetical protein KDG53_04115 [Rhodocyclaceae bacterium]|nr:hypothetical protein [Rhodocyclaceae bacterium]MCW5614470.1 hypothetical protein [Rhodocyclaceae bacterium]
MSLGLATIPITAPAQIFSAALLASSHPAPQPALLSRRSLFIHVSFAWLRWFLFPALRNKRASIAKNAEAILAATALAFAGVRFRPKPLSARQDPSAGCAAQQPGLTTSPGTALKQM